MFFILSLLGNVTYGAGVSNHTSSSPRSILTLPIQILCHSTEKDYFLTNLPWLIGSLGTMFEDVIIFAQFRIYAAQEPHPSAVL